MKVLRKCVFLLDICCVKTCCIQALNLLSMETAVEKAKEMRRRGKDINYRPRAENKDLIGAHQETKKSEEISTG